MLRMVSLGLNSTIALCDGNKIPQFGLGTWTLTSSAACEKAILAAIKVGYRHFDTAELYDNEKYVAQSILKSGVPRDQIWITTKVWESHHGYGSCINHVQKTLKNMNLDYVDMYLIHAPGRGNNVETYKALLEMKEKGLIRSVGVSNFGVQHLKGLKSAGLPNPAVNQIELHPWRQFKDIVSYCREEGIAVEGYSPLVKGGRLNDKTLVNIAKKYNKSTSQILIRWSLQNGFITIPMSSNPDHILENSQVFDFEISDEDMGTLSSFKDRGCTWNPTTSSWTG